MLTDHNPSDPDQDCEHQEEHTRDRIEQRDGDRNPERRTRMVTRERCVGLSRAPDVGDMVHLEGTVAVPRRRDHLVDEKPERGRAEGRAGSELPFAVTARARKQPEAEGSDPDQDRPVRLDCVKGAPEPGVVRDEGVDRVVDAPVHSRPPYSYS